jgi:hypothetical protein
MCSQRGEERGIDLGVGTAERDEGIVTQIGDHTDLTAVVQRCRYLVVDAGWVDVARAYHQWGKPERCYAALLAAERAAPAEVRYRLEGAITTALVNPSPQAARDARLAAAALLAHAFGEPHAAASPRRT